MPLTPTLSPLVPRGESKAFDFKLQHWGLSAPSASHRAVLVLSSISAPTRAAHDPTRLGAGVDAVLEHGHTVYEDVKHAGRVLVRLLISSVVLDFVGVEHDNIREVAGPQRGTPIELQRLGRKRGQSSDRFFEGNNLPVADVFSEQSSEVAVSARMRV